MTAYFVSRTGNTKISTRGLQPWWSLVYFRGVVLIKQMCNCIKCKEYKWKRKLCLHTYYSYLLTRLYGSKSGILSFFFLYSQYLEHNSLSVCLLSDYMDKPSDKLSCWLERAVSWCLDRTTRSWDKEPSLHPVKFLKGKLSLDHFTYSWEVCLGNFLK